MLFQQAVDIRQNFSQLFVHPALQLQHARGQFGQLFRDTLGIRGGALLWLGPLRTCANREYREAIGNAKSPLIGGRLHAMVVPLSAYWRKLLALGIVCFTSFQTTSIAA